MPPPVLCFRGSSDGLRGGGTAETRADLGPLRGIFLAHSGLREMALWVPSYLGPSVGPKVFEV